MELEHHEMDFLQSLETSFWSLVQYIAGKQLLNKVSRACEMAQGEGSWLCLTDNLRMIPWTHMMEGENHLSKFPQTSRPAIPLSIINAENKKTGNEKTN